MAFSCSKTRYFLLSFRSQVFQALRVKARPRLFLKDRRQNPALHSVVPLLQSRVGGGAWGASLSSVIDQHAALLPVCRAKAQEQVCLRTKRPG